MGEAGAKANGMGSEMESTTTNRAELGGFESVAGWFAALPVFLTRLMGYYHHHSWPISLDSDRTEGIRIRLGLPDHLPQSSCGGV